MYPDDNNKPPLGEALNKKAQITLDKVSKNGVWTDNMVDVSIHQDPVPAIAIHICSP